jgi:predicted DNA-binding protein (UPF0251 family)|nr:MAG TPA: ECF sigma factor [Caudoviricetes sp.]
MEREEFRRTIKKGSSMTKEEVRKAFCYPYASILDFALSLVNLKENELQAITLADIKGKGEERTAESMDISVRAVSNLKCSGYKKICMVWDAVPIVRDMIETVERQGLS